MYRPHSHCATWLLVLAAMTCAIPAKAQRGLEGPEPPARQSVFRGLVLGAGTVLLMIPLPVALAARRDAGFNLRHPQQRERNRGGLVTDADRNRLLELWQDTRRAPYLYASVGAAIATAAVASINMLYEPAHVPRWIATVGGVVGLSFAAWGIVDIALGDACAVDRRRVSCSTALERRDEGAVRLIASAPLLSIPVIYLVRKALAHLSRQSLQISFSPQVVPEQRAALLNAQIQWL